jgi:hypothetical protein
MRKFIIAAAVATLGFTAIAPAIASAEGTHVNTHGPVKIPVHLCVHMKQNKQVRLAKKCNRNERGTTIWLKSVPGLRGLRGIEGLQGLIGPAGKNGVNGTNGVNGKDGVQGLPGAQGPAGTPAPMPWSIADVTTGNAGVVVPDGDAAVKNVSLHYEAGQTITVKGVVTGGSVATDDPVADVVINGVPYWSVNQINPDYGVTKTQYVNTESFTQTLVPVTGNANTPAPSGTITQIGLTADNDGGQAGATVTFTDIEVNGVSIPLS